MQQNVTAVTMKHPTGRYWQTCFLLLSVFRNKSRAVSVGAADLMSDLFILTDTEPEWTVPTNKYYIKQSWNASLSLPHSSEVLQHSSSSQRRTVRLHPPPKFTYYSPHCLKKVLCLMGHSLAMGNIIWHLNYALSVIWIKSSMLNVSYPYTLLFNLELILN